MYVFYYCLSTYTCNVVIHLIIFNAIIIFGLAPPLAAWGGSGRGPGRDPGLDPDPAPGMAHESTFDADTDNYIDYLKNISKFFLL